MKYKVFKKAGRFYVELHAKGQGARVVKGVHRSPCPWRKTVIGTRYFASLEDVQEWIKEDIKQRGGPVYEA